MKYYDFLESNKKEVIEGLEKLMRLYKVEPVGNGFIDCIVMKNKLEEFIIEVSNLGLLVAAASWWCYVNSNESEHTGCPHGMGGPCSTYYGGWLSELQNDIYELDEGIIKDILALYNKQSIYTANIKTLNKIKSILEIPFRYTPTEYIDSNKCVNPGLWLLVPNNWKNSIKEMDIV